MHRGRPYPRHPTYWATEAWFWPGFVPWKMKIAVGTLTVEPWNQIPPNFAAVSFPGFCQDPPTIISYEITVVGGSPPLTLRVYLERHGTFPDYKARWRVELAQNWIFVMSTAYALQEYPQRVISVDQFDYCAPVDPYEYTGPVAMSFRPATYADGGSPYD